MRPRPLDGYSDHTHNVWTGAVAVGCGAQILEVHVRAYDTDPGNPDYATALDPAEFALYAQGVRTAERLIADVPVDESAMRPFKMRATP
jgi:sialic acid synthase SpsE